MEAAEAFKKSDTVIIPVGTLHGHGPTPISIDSSAVERFADEVGKKTGILVLPVVPYGENDKMKNYPGSIAISPSVLEGFYTDICMSLHRNGIRKIVFLNGHGGNRESLIRTARKMRSLGTVVAILEWWSIGKQIRPDLFTDEGTGAGWSGWTELAVAVAIGGKEVSDLRGGGYKGEWGGDYDGKRPALKQIFGEKIKPLGFNDFEYDGARLMIPVDAWDIDLAVPPDVKKESLDRLTKLGHEIVDSMVDYIARFVREFEKIDVSKALSNP